MNRSPIPGPVSIIKNMECLSLALAISLFYPRYKMQLMRCPSMEAYAKRAVTDLWTSTIFISPLLTVLGFFTIPLDSTWQYSTDLRVFMEKEKTKKDYTEGSWLMTIYHFQSTLHASSLNILNIVFTWKAAFLCLGVHWFFFSMTHVELYFWHEHM